MNSMINDVFISYRRKGGFATANHLNERLVRDGYTVSFDIKSLREGRFDQTLLSLIEQCSDFILVVDEHAFDRMTIPDADPKDDWLRQELSYALQLKKNVIPVLLPGAEFPTNLPDDVKDVRYQNGPEYSRGYFDRFYGELKSFMHSLPRNQAMMAADGSLPTATIPYLKVKADLDCIFYLDGEEKARLKAGMLQKVPLRQGEYELTFVSCEDAADRLEMEFEMPDADKLQKVFLCEIRDKRLLDEVAEARRMTEEETRRLAEERRKAEEKKRADEEARCIFTVNDVSFKMIRVEGSTFRMGDTPEQDRDAFADENPAHQVTLSDYYIGETQVTQALWQAVMGYNPSRFKGANRPVECVSWNDCQRFIVKLNKLTGKSFHLPTEAEWEFAARGGKNSRGYKYSGSNNLDEVAWFADNNNRETKDVKKKLANELGLYDMSGNVWEWCNDWYGKYPSSPQTNPQGPSSGSDRVIRGGSWNNRMRVCRSVFCNYYSPSLSGDDLGLRLAL